MISDNKRMADAQAVIDKLMTSGLIAASSRSLPRSQLVQSDTKVAETPWFLQVFFGISGFVAGLAIIGFLVLSLQSIIEETLTQVLLGVTLLGISFALFAYCLRDFLISLSFALSVAGQVFLAVAIFSNVYGMFNDHEVFSLTTGIFLLMLLQLLLLVMMPHFVHRLLTGFNALACLVALLVYHHLLEVSAGALALIMVVCGLQYHKLLVFSHSAVLRHHWLQVGRALAYASAVMLLSVSVFFIVADGGYRAVGVYDDTLSYNYYLAQALLTSVSLYAGYIILRRYQIGVFSLCGIVVSVAIMMIGVISVYVSGLLAACLVIMIAMANRLRVLMALGIIALVGYVFWYYYQLDTTLLVKSASMLAVGVFLLLLRWLLVSSGMIHSIDADNEHEHSDCRQSIQDNDDMGIS